MSNLSSFTFKIAKKRKLKLHKHFVIGWIGSRLSPKGKHSLSTLQRAFSSIHTTDETRNAVINAVFNPTLKYSDKLGIRGLELHVEETPTKQPYLQWRDGNGNNVLFNTPLQHQILKSSQIIYPFNHMMKSISKLTTPQQTSKALNAAVWFSGYLGLITDINFIVRGFLNHSDIDTIFWAYPPKLENSADYHSYLSYEAAGSFYDILDKDYPDFSVVERNQESFTSSLTPFLNDLKSYDDFIGSLGLESGIAAKHQEFKDGLSKLLNISTTDEWKKLSDTTMINEHRIRQFNEARGKNGIKEEHYGFYVYWYSLLSIIDIGWEIGESITKVDITDPDIMDKFMRIHGNKKLPNTNRQWFFEEPIIEAHGAKMYFSERESWLKAEVKQSLFPKWLIKEIEDTS